MRRAVCSVLLILVLLIAQVGMAGTPKSNNRPTVTGPLTASAATTPAVTQLQQVRWAVRTDAVTGANSLRLVFDVSGPVAVVRDLTDAPTPCLVINVKGAVPGKIGNSIDFDGAIVDKVNIDAMNGQNTRITVEMPLMVEDTDYRVFTLPSDAKAGRPFRIVVDIYKPLPQVDFHFAAGLRGKVIAIDPGHGGSDPGAIGPAGTQEKSVTLAVALKVKTLLERAGAKVLMTRKVDKDVYGSFALDVNELKARTTVANQGKADIFLSIHANSFTNPAVVGTSTYYYRKTSYDAMLAQCIQSSVIADNGLSDRGSIPINFYVINHTVMPAALLEIGFLSNYSEEKLLNDPLFQQKVAQGIVQGMDRFFTQAAAKSGGDR